VQNARFLKGLRKMIVSSHVGHRTLFYFFPFSEVFHDAEVVARAGFFLLDKHITTAILDN